MSGAASEFTTPEDFSGSPRAPLPPQIGIARGVGVGKTDHVIGLTNDKLAADPNAAAAMFVPDHVMGAELAGRCRPAMPGISVEIYRGTIQPDPVTPQQQMCLRSKDVADAQKAGGAEGDVCGSKKRGLCPHSGACGRHRQMAAIKNARIVIFPHSMLGRPAPGFAPKPDLVFIDEAFHGALLGGPTRVALDALDPQSLPSIPDAGGVAGLDDRDTRRVVGLLYGLVARTAPHERLPKGVLSAVGLSAAQLRRARVCLLRAKHDLPIGLLPTAPVGSVGGLLGPLAVENERILRVAKLLEVAADILDGRLGSAGLRVDSGGNVVVRWRDDIHPDWLEAKYGVLHADATMQVDIVRVFLPRLTLAPAPPIAAPHMRVTQVADDFCGVSSLVAPVSASVHGRSAAANKMRDVQRFVDALAGDYQGQGAPGGPDVLTVSPKKIEAELVPHLPANAATLHYGKLRGQDAYKGVAALVSVSWLMPPPHAVEDEAELIFGKDVTRLGHKKFYEKRQVPRVMADGTARVAEEYHHPDPAADAVLQSKCAAELVQAIGRGRGARRTAATPLDVFVLTSIPIPGLPVDNLVTWEELMRAFVGPVTAMCRAGLLPLDWPGREALLAGLGLRLPAKAGARPGNALRQWFRNNLEDADLLREACGAVQGKRAVSNKPLRDILLRGLLLTRTPAAPSAVAQPGPGAWSCFRYRRGGARQSSRILVSPQHADPRADVEALLGPLDLFEPDKAARPSRAIPRNSTSAAAVAAPPAGGTALAPVTTPPAPSGEEALTARLDAVPIGLPALMTALEAGAWITAATRRRHMDRFRAARGTLEERERQTLARIAKEVGADTLQWAVRAAAARSLGLPHTVLAQTPGRQVQAA